MIQTYIDFLTARIELKNKFMIKYLKTFTYRKRYTKEETVNLLKIARR